MVQIVIILMRTTNQMLQPTLKLQIVIIAKLKFMKIQTAMTVTKKLIKKINHLVVKAIRIVILVLKSLEIIKLAVVLVQEVMSVTNLMMKIMPRKEDLLWVVIVKMSKKQNLNWGMLDQIVTTAMSKKLVLKELHNMLLVKVIQTPRLLITVIKKVTEVQTVTNNN